MKIIPTTLDGLVIVAPSVFEDERGYFMEMHRQNGYRAAGVDLPLDDLQQPPANLLRIGQLTGRQLLSHPADDVPRQPVGHLVLHEPEVHLEEDLRQMGLIGPAFDERLDGLDTTLDRIEELLEDWQSREEGY